MTRASDTTPSSTGQLVDPKGPRNPVCIGQESWSTPRALGHWPEATGTAGRHREILEPGVSPPGELVDTTGPQTLARVAQESRWTPWSTDTRPSSLEHLVNPMGPPGPHRESPGTAGRPHIPSEQGTSPPGQQVDTTGHRTRARVSPESWSTPRELRPKPESPRSACQHCGASDTSASSPGQLVDITDPQTLA